MFHRCRRASIGKVFRRCFRLADETPERRAKTGRTVAPPDNIAGRFYGDPAKALVMAHIGQCVRDGHAEWTMLDSGDVELRFCSGEVFLLADATMTRVM